MYKADVIVKVAPPSLSELELFHADQILISPLQIPIISEEYIEKLRKKRVIAVAMEYLQASDGSFPVVRIMSEIAGISAMHTAAELLSNVKGGRGVLLGGVSGVPPAKVVHTRSRRRRRVCHPAPHWGWVLLYESSTMMYTN